MTAPPVSPNYPFATFTQQVARDARLDRLRRLWALYGYEIRLIDGWYPEAGITICKVAKDGHLDRNQSLHGLWGDTEEIWLTLMKEHV